MVFILGIDALQNHQQLDGAARIVLALLMVDVMRMRLEAWFLFLMVPHHKQHQLIYRLITIYPSRS